MTDAGGGSATAPIFHHRLCLAEMLLLPNGDDGEDGDDDEDVDTRLLAAARESGIEDPHLFLVPPPAILDISTLSLSTEQRSSSSVHSHETPSTAPTSLLSRHSHDKSPVSRLPPPSFVRASFSVDRHVGPSDIPPTLLHHRYSSVSTSMSLPAPSGLRPHLSRRTKRATALFSLFRNDHRSHCPSRSHRHDYFKPQSSKLECGHSLSKYAIRIHVQEALEKKDGAPPACCGYPLPHRVLAIVLTNVEANPVADRLMSSPVPVSWRDSGYGENGMSSTYLPHIRNTQHFGSRSALSPTPTMELDEEEALKLKSALSSEAFRVLSTSQREQFQRISASETSQRRALLLNHQSSLGRLMPLFESSKTEKKHQHVQQLEYLDDFQLRTEHNVREAHHMEIRNVATALKHMEAYCLGPSSTHPEILYTVTKEDREKLHHQRAVQAKLPIKHESAINVLRAKQERDTRIKVQKQQAELDQLKKDYEEMKRVQEEKYERDRRRLETVIKTRRSRVVQRWDLRFEIWRRSWQKESRMPLIGDIPHQDWPVL